MYKWIVQAYKGKPHELKNRNKERALDRICCICGKPLHSSGNMCDSCERFIRQKQDDERKGK